MTNGKGWYEPEPLGVPGGEQTQKLIEEMCEAASLTSADMSRAGMLKLMAELEQTNPNSPVLARAKAALAAEAKDAEAG
jgi:hypothetical protein